jgi:inner membrane protein
MEPITQGLLGAAAGELAAGRALGRRALFWGALVGMSPDLDVLLSPLHHGFGEWIHHRGTTHALWFGFVVGPGLAAFLWRWQDREARTAYTAWLALAVAALVTHPLLDGFTPYGTQLFAPFSRARFAWNGVGIVDPFYSVLLGVGVWIAADSARPARDRRAGLLVFVVLSTLYLVVGVALARWTQADLRSSLEAEGLRVERVTAYPTLLQPWLRHFVAHGESEVYVGWHSLLRPGCPSWRVRRPPSADPRGRALLATWEGGILAWFADGEIGLETRPSPRGSLVAIDDLRYAWGSASALGLWGIAADFDDQGRLHGAPRRFGRGEASARDLGAFLSTIAGDLPGEAQGFRRPTRCDP